MAYDDYYQVEQADLEVANSSCDFQYSYHDIGNRLSARDDTVTTTYTANSLNQYDTISGFANPTYDSNGSLLTHDGKTYSWNEDVARQREDGEAGGLAPTVVGAEETGALGAVTKQNRLSRVDKADGSYVTFLYDGLGRRISKKSYNSSSTLVADRLFEYADFTIIREAESVGSEVKQDTIGNDLANALSGTGGIGAILAMHDGASDYYYFYDGNYNVSQVVDSTSAVVAEYEYSPFGEAIVETGVLASGNPIRFSSKYFDEEAGMLYYGFRYYSPELGRWPSRDPIEEGDGSNMFSFVGNDALNHVDLWVWKR